MALWKLGKGNGNSVSRYLKMKKLGSVKGTVNSCLARVFGGNSGSYGPRYLEARL